MYTLLKIQSFPGYGLEKNGVFDKPALFFISELKGCKAGRKTFILMSFFLKKT